MSDIVPDPAGLGLASPQLGPWFQGNVNLGDPDPNDLSVTIPSTVWQPPAAGTLALVVPASTTAGDETLLHASLARLRNLAGAARFVDEPGKLLALFTLLPEVVVRLRQLYLEVARLGSRADNTLRRDVPAQFALLFQAPADQAGLDDMLPGLDVAQVGLGPLGLEFDGGFRNGRRPMAWLRRPGEVIPGQREDLIDLVGVQEAKLFAFDELGQPLDPGAVASAFTDLQLAFLNLTVGAALPSFNNGRRFHLVNPMGGAPDPDLRPLLRQRGAALPGGGNLVDFTADLSLSFAASDLTERPFLRTAVLPAGPYATTAALADQRLMARDFFRVGLADLEVLLAGDTRKNGTPARKQTRASTRIDLVRSTADPTLLPHQEAVLGGVRDVVGGQDPAILVSGVLEGSAGPVTAPDLPALRLPDALISITLLPLQGGRGPDDPGNPDWAPAALGVVQVELDASLVGGWVHVAPLDFDLETSERKRLAGGGGRLVAADGNARATVLLTLPPGDATPDGDDVVAFDVEIAARDGKRLIGTQKAPRTPRPPETPGPVAVGPGGGFPPEAAALIVCETGQRLLPGGALVLPSGASVVAELSGGGFARLDTGAAPYSVFGDGLGARLAGGDAVVTTARVWKDDPTGDETTRVSGTGATVLQAGRDQLNTLDDPGAPLPLLERQDIQASAVGGGRADAVVAALPLLDRYHELNPARPGRADEPATSEAHGTGARLTGPAALLAAEAAADRRFASTVDLLEAVTNNPPPPPPADPPGPGPIVSLLRTVASAVEGEPQLHAAAALPEEASYPFDGSTVEKTAWLTALELSPLPLPADAAADRRFRRFADRRVLAALKGLSEAGEIVVKLIQKAERFVFIESSDLTALDGNEDKDRPLNVRQALRDRLLTNPDLHVLVCLPFEPVHPYLGMRRFLTHRNNQAIAAFRTGEAPEGSFSPPIKDRVVVFSPFAGARRPLRIAATTVIVDDVVAVTGGFALSRRGLTFDSSLAVALFDERLTRERSREVFQFRQQLLASRLGERSEDLPADGAAVAAMVRQALQGGFTRNISLPKPPTGPDPGTGFAAAYDPDGRAEAGFSATTYLAALAVDVALRDQLA
jgi:hypothetical protein